MHMVHCGEYQKSTALQIEYTTYRVSEDIINVGTYYIPLK